MFKVKNMAAKSQIILIGFQQEIKINAIFKLRNDFKSKKTYWDHMKKHTTLAYPCNLCPAVYKE